MGLQCLRIFGEKLTHLGGTSPYALTCECPPRDHMHGTRALSTMCKLISYGHLALASTIDEICER